MKTRTMVVALVALGSALLTLTASGSVPAREPLKGLDVTTTEADCGRQLADPRQAAMSPLLDESAILGKGEICEDPKMAFPRRVEGCFEFGCHGECYWYLECCGGYGDPSTCNRCMVERCTCVCQM